MLLQVLSSLYLSIYTYIYMCVMCVCGVFHLLSRVCTKRIWWRGSTTRNQCTNYVYAGCVLFSFFLTTLQFTVFLSLFVCVCGVCVCVISGGSDCSVRGCWYYWKVCFSSFFPFFSHHTFNSLADQIANMNAQGMSLLFLLSFPHTHCRGRIPRENYKSTFFLKKKIA